MSGVDPFGQRVEKEKQLEFSSGLVAARARAFHFCVRNSSIPPHDSVRDATVTWSSPAQHGASLQTVCRPCNCNNFLLTLEVRLSKKSCDIVDRCALSKLLVDVTYTVTHMAAVGTLWRTAKMCSDGWVATPALSIWNAGTAWSTIKTLHGTIGEWCGTNILAHNHPFTPLLRPLLHIVRDASCGADTGI